MRELARDEAAAGKRLEQTLVLERHQRDPQRRPRHAELLDEPQLGDALPRLERAAQQQLAKTQRRLHRLRVRRVAARHAPDPNASGSSVACKRRRRPGGTGTLRHRIAATAYRVGSPRMSARTTPPFRADHVGSLLRPPQLLRAREDHAAGRIDTDELRRVEDDAIREIVRRQEDVGLQLRDRRRVPPRVVAHGLHLPARRHHEGSRPHQGQVPQRAGRHRVHAGRAPRRRQARRLAERSSATPSSSCARRSRRTSRS